MAGVLGKRAGMVNAVNEIVSDPQLRERIKLRAMTAKSDDEVVAAIREALRAEHQKLNEQRADMASELKRLDRLGDALRDVVDWGEAGVVLQSAQESALHKISPTNVMLCTKLAWVVPPEIEQAQSEGAVFLVQHDWAALLATADVDTGAIRLPFDRCCFEFEISGRRICVVVACREGEPYRIIPLIRARGGWLILRSYAVDGAEVTEEGEEFDAERPRFVSLVVDNIRAIAISLDAEVVTRQLVRATHHGTAPGLKRGALPQFDHHILTLTARRGGDRLSVGSGTYTRKRLHFRRGHWRHFPNHKTWIKWMLVGDASLGFADKDYRL